MSFLRTGDLGHISVLLGQETFRTSWDIAHSHAGCPGPCRSIPGDLREQPGIQTPWVGTILTHILVVDGLL